MKRFAIILAALPLACCRRAPVAPPPHRIESAVVVRSEIEHPRRLFALHPSASSAGKTFQAQEGGYSAILLTGWGFTRSDRVFWNGTPLATTFSDRTMMSALVPPALLVRPGDARVEVRDPAEPSAGALFATFRVAR